MEYVEVTNYYDNDRDEINGIVSKTHPYMVTHMKSGVIEDIVAVREIKDALGMFNIPADIEVRDIRGE